MELADSGKCAKLQETRTRLDPPSRPTHRLLKTSRDLGGSTHNATPQPNPPVKTRITSPARLTRCHLTRRLPNSSPDRPHLLGNPIENLLLKLSSIFCVFSWAQPHPIGLSTSIADQIFNSLFNYPLQRAIGVSLPICNNQPLGSFMIAIQQVD